MPMSDDSQLPRERSTASVRICRLEGLEPSVQADTLAVEEPLEIRLVSSADGRRSERSIAVTMRTPGHDLELALGFLLAEGMVQSREQVDRMHVCGAGNVACVELQPGLALDLSRLERHSYVSSSCGVCGKRSLEDLHHLVPGSPLEDGPVIDAVLIHQLPALLRRTQAVFNRTGGLHAAALFDRRARLICLHEDVGRHNALDKVIGAQFLVGNIPLPDSILLLSGRASFELVQKAAVAGIPILAAVGAPSSLAVELARQQRMTLLGFVRDNQLNIYCGAGRIQQAANALPDPVPPGSLPLTLLSS